MKEKVVIWGAGRLLVNSKRYINWDEILCIVDNNSQKYGEIIEGRVIVSPNDLFEVKFDKVIVFVSGFYDEICLRLTKELGVEPEKVLYWCDYLKHYSIQETMEQILGDVYQKDCTNLLDLKKSFWQNHVYAYSNDHVTVTIKAEERKEDYALGRKLYETLGTCKPKEQSAVFLGRIAEYEQPEWDKWFVQYKAGTNT